MKYNDLYSEYLDAVEKKLDEYVALKEPVTLYEPFRYLVSGGGKRVRPVLTMICCGAVGGDPYDALNAGTALEILHNFTLAHDDIMDESPMRRGRDTVHVKWNEPTAILLGDLMVGRAYKLLPSSKEHPRSDEIIAAFTRGLIVVCEGQGFDMDFNEKKDVTIDDYLLMIEKKTASLLETAALMGAHLGNGSKSEVAKLKEFAWNMGIAFQIQDDLLDLTAEQEKLGKKIGQDILEGKKTYLILKAMELAREDKDIQLLAKFYKNNGLDEEYVPQMAEMFERTGVLDEADKAVDLYHNQAIEALGALEQNAYTEMLRWLINKMNKRSY